MQQRSQRLTPLQEAFKAFDTVNQKYSQIEDWYDNEIVAAHLYRSHAINNSMIIDDYKLRLNVQAKVCDRLISHYEKIDKFREKSIAECLKAKKDLDLDLILEHTYTDENMLKIHHESQMILKKKLEDELVYRRQKRSKEKLNAGTRNKHIHERDQQEETADEGTGDRAFSDD